MTLHLLQAQKTRHELTLNWKKCFVIDITLIFLFIHLT